MKNLHLKNLNNTDIIDIYLNKIEKIYNNNYDFEKLITLLKKLYTYIEKELETINIINPDIQKYKKYLIDYIRDIKEKELKYPAKKNTYSITNHKILTEYFKNNIEKLKLLKDIDINLQWINLDYEYQQYNSINNEQVLTISHIENHLTPSHKELNISIDSDNIIKKITMDDY